MVVCDVIFMVGLAKECGHAPVRKRTCSTVLVVALHTMSEYGQALDVASPSALPILLLKTRATPTDGYQEYFSTVDSELDLPVFVPVLEHRLKDDSLSELLELIQSGAFQTDGRGGRSEVRYGGIIFTSQRAVKAFATVVEKLRKKPLPLDVLLPSILPLYVVGPATARGLKALALRCPIVGEDSGNGEVLANFILDHYRQNGPWKASTEATNLPLLFLVGEQRRDVIPKTLQSDSVEPSKRIRVRELVVYESGEMSSFKSEFLAIWLKSRRFTRSWIVVFSPTGCRAMLESLAMLDESSGKVKEDSAKIVRPMIATIGPTTRDFLVKEFGFHPEVCASKPSPEGLAESIARFMQSKTI